MASLEPESAKKALESLQHFNVVYAGNKVTAFIEWAREHAERMYPDIGTRSYVVPPIFVHKHSMRYDPAAGADVLQETQKSSPKGEKAHNLVAKSFAMLSPQLKRPVFLISGLEYDNMLKWVRHYSDLAPALPDAVENRGDIDIMLIHPRHGVVFIQVKAVGDNAESRTQTEIHKRIVLGGRQLRKDENILRWVLHDLEEAASCHVTRVVALPNLTHDELASFWPPADLDPDSEDAKNTDGVFFLCKDDLPMPEGSATPEADTDVTSLMTWWNQHVAGVDGNLSESFMKDLVSRYVGMLSAVEVYAGNNLRKEVRLTSDAVDVCGMMFRRILLNEEQLRILSAPCQRRYLSGPPGSGKTVILLLRSRQFVRQGGYVIVINMYRGAAGRAIGHFIREGVARFRVPQGHEGKKSKAKSKAKKKKGEEKPSVEDTPPIEREAQETPPPNRKLPGTPPTVKLGGNKTPPTPRKAVEANHPARKRHDTPPSSRQTTDTPPASRKGQNARMTTTQAHGTPPSAKKVIGTPPSCRKSQGTPPPNRNSQGTPPPFRKSQGTPPPCRNSQGTPPPFRNSQGTPPHCRSSQGTPPPFRNSQGTPPPFRTDNQGTPTFCRKNHGTPPPSRKGHETELDMSDRVHSIDVDIDCSSFNSKAFEAEIRHWLPDDVKAYDVLFIVDEIYVTEYWKAILDVLDQGFQGCHIWCAGLYSRNPPGFEQEDLRNVLRCPPLVQKVLHAVDWDENRKTCYRLNTDLSGISSPGLTPLCVRHKDHPQVSITECELCAEELSSLLHDGLKLDPEASKGRVPLSCSDVVMLVNIPRAFYEPDERGFLDTTKQDFTTYMAYLKLCPLVSALQRNSVPVKVIGELPCLNLYNLEEGQIAAAWAYAYQGLENKVVIYLPGDTPWHPETHSREIPAPGLCSTPRDEPKVWEPVKGLQMEESMNQPQEHLQPDTQRDPVTLDNVADVFEDKAENVGSRTRSESSSLSLSDFWWKTSDVHRYSNWDKSNLFVAGSRCLSQLIMLIP